MRTLIYTLIYLIGWTVAVLFMDHVLQWKQSHWVMMYGIVTMTPWYVVSRTIAQSIGRKS